MKHALLAILLLAAYAIADSTDRPPSKEAEEYKYDPKAIASHFSTMQDSQTKFFDQWTAFMKATDEQSREDHFRRAQTYAAWHHAMYTDTLARMANRKAEKMKRK